MFGMSMKISSIWPWNMSPTGTVPNGICLYQYQPHEHANIIKYDDFLSNFKLWYPKLTSIIDIYYTLLNIGRVSFDMQPLWRSLINVWFNLAGSKHNLTLLFALGTNTNLLHHSTVSSIPSGMIMSSFCSWSNSSLKAFSSTYATHLSGI